MGVLDDAIREHLELKRKHGVPDAEVERQQQEALGPPQRQPAAADGEAESAAPASEEAVGEPIEEAVRPASVEPEAAEPEPLEAAEPPEPEAAAVEEAVEDLISEEVEPEADPEALLDERDVAGPAGDPLAEDEPDWDFGSARDEEPATGDTPPRGFDAVEEPGEEGNGEDVLEETPDFLQETPEHDRLWFEQKPPRDFDFDDDEK